MPKTVKIFISSTFRDMNAERDVLIKNVFPRLREKAEEIGLFIREVDLRWGVTEEEAKRGEALEICLDGIEECRPYFLCMLGKRYGWIPAPNYIRVDDFEEILLSSALSAEDSQLLKESYHKTEDEGRIYSLDNSLSNETKDHLQMILEKAGLSEAMDSITEKEINHAVLNNEMPRFIPQLDSILENLPPEKRLTPAEDTLLKRLYLRTSGEPVWHLLPGVTPDEKEQLIPILQKIDFKIEMHSFFYFRQDIGEDHPDFIETHPLPINKLIKLKQRICDSDKPVVKPKSLDDGYPCAWKRENLEGTTNHPIQQLAEFEERVFNDLWKHIQQNKELQIDEDKDKTELEKELDHHFKFIDSRTYNFHGREALIDELTEKINLALEGKLVLDKKDYEGNPVKTQQIMVVGEPGSGKSALFAKLYQNLCSQVSDLRSPTSDLFVIPWFIGASSKSTNPRYILTYFCQMLINEFNITEEVKNEDSKDTGKKLPEIPWDQNELEEKFKEFLDKATRPVIFIIDAINQLQEEENARKMTWLPDELPKNICIISSLVEDKCRKNESLDIEADTTALNAMRKKFRTPYEISVTKLSESEQNEIIENYLGLFYKKLPDDLRKILTNKQEAYNPLYLHVALEELRIFSKHEELEDFIENRIPENVVNMFGAVLDRVEKDIAGRFAEIERNLFRELMTNIAIGRGGMTEEDLLLRLGDWQKIKDIGTEEARFSDFHWGELRRSIRAYIFTREDKWDFFHQQLKQAVSLKYLPDRESMYKANKEIADYLELMGYGHLTTLMDLPYHLVKAGELQSPTPEKASDEWSRVTRVLTDIDFIDAKTKANLVYELIADYTQADDAWPSQKELNITKTPQCQTEQYIRELVNYSLAPEKTYLPNPPKALEGETFELDSIEDKTHEWSPLEQIRAWSNFVNTNIPSLLLKEEPCFQLAFNSIEGGPVAEEMEKRGKEGKMPGGPWFRLLNRTSYSPLPQCQRVLEIEGPIVAVPDLNLALSVGKDQFLQIIDTSDEECIHQLKGHENNVEKGPVAVTPDGKWAVTLGSDKTLLVWNLEKGELYRTLDSRSRAINGLTITPDGRFVVAGCGKPGSRNEDGEDPAVYMWDIEQGKCIRAIFMLQSDVHSLAVTPDSEILVTGKRDQSAHEPTLRVWDLRKSKCIKEIKGAENIRQKIIPEEHKIFQLVSKDTGKPLETTETTEEGGVKGLAITPDGKLAVSAHGNFDKMVRVWNLEKGNLVHKLEGHNSQVNCVAITPDGRFAISGGDDRTVRLWDIENGSCLNVFNGHRGPIKSVFFSLNGTQAISASEDGTLRIWNVTKGKNKSSGTGYSSGERIVAISPCGPKAVSGGRAKLNVWNAENGKLIKSLEGQVGEIQAIKILPDGHHVLSGNGTPFWRDPFKPVVHDNTVRLWDIGKGLCEKTFELHKVRVDKLLVTPDGKRCLSAGGATTSEDECFIAVWDLESGKCINKLIGHERRINSMSITPDGRRVLSSSEDKTLKLWDVETGECLKTLSYGLQATNLLTLLDGGRRVLTTGSTGQDYDYFLGIWDLASGERTHMLNDHTEPVEVAAERYDGKVIASGGGWSLGSDFGIRLWDIEEQLPLRNLKGHSGPITAITFSPNGQYIFSASADGTLRIWDAESGQCARIYRTRGDKVNSMAAYMNRLAVCTTSGLDFMEVEGCSLGTPKALARRLWMYSDAGEKGRWDDSLSTICLYCGESVNVPQECLGQTVEFPCCANSIDICDTAVDFFQELETARKIANNDTQDPLLLTRLGDMLSLDTNEGKAEDYWQKGLSLTPEEELQKALKRRLGENDSMTPETEDELFKKADSLFTNGDFQGARPLLEKVLAYREETYGMYNMSTLEIRMMLASTLICLDNKDAAEPLYLLCLKAFEATVGLENTTAASVANTLGLIFYGKRDYPKAKEFFKKALIGKEKQFGFEHKDTALTLINIAQSHRFAGDLEEAEEFARKALHSYEQAFGLEHIETAQTTFVLAGILEQKGNFEEALDLYSRVLKIHEDELGPEHVDTITARTALEKVQMVVNRDKEAKEL